MSGAAFYCVADARYFPGAAAMINSLRLQGHREPVYVLDLGLADAQRALLGAEASVVEADPATPPWLAKTIAPLAHPAETMVLIDADMIATRPLHELVASVRGDGVMAFRNDADRWVDEWGELLGLGTLRRRPYVNSGLIVAAGPTGGQTLELLDRLQRKVDIERTFFRSRDRGYAFLYPEQDVLNAILATRIPEDRIVTLEHAFAPTPPYPGVRIADVATLRCVDTAGREPFVLHQFFRKPWLEPVFHGVYSRLLARLLLSDDVAIRVGPETLPVRMRSGARARVERLAVDMFEYGRWSLTERLPAWRRRRAAARGSEAGAR